MKMKRLAWTLLFALGLAAFGSALAVGANVPALPDEVQAVLDDGGTVAILDAEGAVLWDSTSGVALDPTVLEAAASIVIYDVDGNLVAEYPVVTGPNDNPVVDTGEELVGVGKFLRWALDVQPALGTGDPAGATEQNRIQNRHQNQNQNTYQDPTQDPTDDATQDDSGDEADVDTGTASETSTAPQPGPSQGNPNNGAPGGPGQGSGRHP